MATTFDWLCLTLAQDYKLEPALLAPDASLESLGLDSLAITELLFNVEDRFKITVPPELPPLNTIGDVVRLIDACVAARHGGAPASEASK
jgi:acyl carrier protein